MVTAAGGISVVRESVRSMLADVAAFRTWAGTVSGLPTPQEASLAKIHVNQLSTLPAGGGLWTLAELVALRPFVIMDRDETSYRSKSIATNSNGGEEHVASGEIALDFYKDISGALQLLPRDLHETFENDQGAIIDGLRGLSGQSGYAKLDDVDGGPIEQSEYLIEETQGVVGMFGITVAWSQGSV